MKDREGEKNPLEQRTLPNGVTLSFFDGSRPYAGDRCIVELRCEASIPIVEEYWDQGKSDPPPRMHRIRSLMESRLTFTLEKTRNFVPQEEKQATLDELMDQVEQHVLTYLKNPRFPSRLFAKRYDELREKCLLEERQRGFYKPEEEEDKSPPDFSFLFRNDNPSR